MRSLIYLLLAVSMLAVLATPRERDPLVRADAAWRKGQHEQAIRLYKQAWPHAGERRLEIIHCIIHWEKEQGNLDTAREWLDRGIEEGVISPTAFVDEASIINAPWMIRP